MRVILWLGLGLGVAWGGYWFVGSRAVEFQVTAIIADARNQGFEATTSAISVAGFPNRFDLTLTDPHFRDPASGWGWQADLPRSSP